MNCRIELLSPSLLETDADLLARVDRMRNALGLELGWHYWLDLLWILKALRATDRLLVVDAGAGHGLLQFMLAEAGHVVTSVDYSRRRFTLPARLAFRMRSLDGASASDDYLSHLRSRHTEGAGPLRAVANFGRLAILRSSRITRALVGLPALLNTRRKLQRSRPEILIYRSRMEAMRGLASASADAVVSVSAIEHLDPQAAKAAVAEFRRILKPGGRVLVTSTAAKERDWFHEPSKGWCFGERSLRALFGLDQTCPSNWSNYVGILRQIRDSVELKRRISPIYRISGANGMPWGAWEPKYVPVGVMFTVGQ